MHFLLRFDSRYSWRNSGGHGFGDSDQPAWAPNSAPGNINLDYFASECPVDMFKWGDSGLFDVVGNVWQWTETPIDALPGCVLLFFFFSLFFLSCPRCPRRIPGTIHETFLIILVMMSLLGHDRYEVHPLYDDFSSPTFDGLHSVIKGGSWISIGCNGATKDSRCGVSTRFALLLLR